MDCVNYIPPWNEILATLARHNFLIARLPAPSASRKLRLACETIFTCSMQALRQTCRPFPYRASSYCFRYSSGNCNSSSCRFEHVCTGCFSPGHPEVRCPEAKTRAKGCPAEARPSRQPPKPAPPVDKSLH